MILQVSSEEQQQQAARNVAQMTFAEYTSFRQISHLSLRLQPVNEQVMRKHLTELVRRYQVTCR